MKYFFSKQTLAIASLLAFTTSVNAQEEKHFTGFYAGIEGGFGSLKNYARKHNNRWSIGGVLGYRKQFDNDLVLGLEGSLNSVQDIDTANFNSFFDVDYKPTWGASVLLGYAFGQNKKNLVFVKTGYARLRYDVSLIGNLRNDGAEITYPAGTLGEFSKDAWKLGAGYERKLTDRFSVRGGVDYTKHKNQHKQLEAKVAFIVTF